MSAEVLFARVGAMGVITLNRPDALNALTLNMVRLVTPVLHDWADDPGVAHVVIEGAGEKGFCAGGDIRALYDWGRAGAPEAVEFYREEYALNRLIKIFPKPYIALIDGITMGGGVGVSVHGAYRIATERTIFAMPETGIGLLPDVGGTFFLPRLRGETGAWMVLTGARLKAAAACAVGIATHFMPRAQLPLLKADLAKGGDADAILAKHQQPAGHGVGDGISASQQADIDRLFSGQGVLDIIAALQADASDWARKQLATINTKSPTSAAVALRQMRDGAKAGFDECMRIEMRAVSRLMTLPDFYEGVRAVIIDKDNQPQWSPARHEDITDMQIDAIFSPLGEDELNF